MVWGCSLAVQMGEEPSRNWSRRWDFGVAGVAVVGGAPMAREREEGRRELSMRFFAVDVIVPAPTEFWRAADWLCPEDRTSRSLREKVWCMRRREAELMICARFSSTDLGAGLLGEGSMMC